jgi:hypothetical protein
MADNSTLPVSVGTDLFANDDISSVKYPRVKLTWGPDGTANDTDVASGKPVPAQIRTATGTAQTYGSGASDAGTQRVTIGTDQLGSLVNNSVPVITGGFEYETVAVSQTDQIMGATGAVGDYLDCLLCVVATAATSQVQIKDGNGSAITVLPNAVGAGVGVYPIPIGLRCINATTPGWKITTAAGVTVLASGDFT